jgi:hypothetical protein
MAPSAATKEHAIKAVTRTVPVLALRTTTVPIARRFVPLKIVSQRLEWYTLFAAATAPANAKTTTVVDTMVQRVTTASCFSTGLSATFRAPATSMAGVIVTQGRATALRTTTVDTGEVMTAPFALLDGLELSARRSIFSSASMQTVALKFRVRSI